MRAKRPARKRRHQDARARTRVRDLPVGSVVVAFADLIKLGIPYSRVHIDRLVEVEKFPCPIELGENRVAWVRAEVDAWIAAKIAARDAAARAKPNIKREKEKATAERGSV
jgi:predicted DNA-binding transcriptional regulator AlpA